MSLARFLAKQSPGKNGENLYPGAQNPELTLEIDEWIDYMYDFMPKHSFFMVPFLPQYQEKDDHFV